MITLRPWFVLRCDAPGCLEYIVYEESRQDVAECVRLDDRVRQIAELAGWSQPTAAFSSRCPKHRERVDQRPPIVCHAGRDGDCTWTEFPQERDGEPGLMFRPCPLWTGDDDEY